MKPTKRQKLEKELLDIESKIVFLLNKSRMLPFPYSRLAFLKSRHAEIINILKREGWYNRNRTN